VLGVKLLVDDFDVVDEADEDIGFEFGDLVEIEGGEQAVTPAEGGVGVDEHVILAAGFGDDVFEGCSAERVESGDGEIEDAS